MAADAIIHQGDERTLRITIYEDDDETTPKDIDGFSILYRIGEEARDRTLLEKSGQIEDAPNGVCTVTFLEADTASIAPRLYDHQLYITDLLGNGVVAMDGNLRIKKRLNSP